MAVPNELPNEPSIILRINKRNLITSIFSFKVMLSTLSQLGWTNVAVVYTDQPEGTLGFRSLSQDASNAGVCISQSVRVPAGSSGKCLVDVLNRLHAFLKEYVRGVDTGLKGVCIGGGGQKKEVPDPQKLPGFAPECTDKP